MWIKWVKNKRLSKLVCRLDDKGRAEAFNDKSLVSLSVETFQSLEKLNEWIEISPLEFLIISGLDAKAMLNIVKHLVKSGHHKEARALVGLIK